MGHVGLAVTRHRDRRSGGVMTRWAPIKFAMLLASLPLNFVARAADRHFNVGSGLWSASSSWSPAAVPAPADNAVVDFANGRAIVNTTAIGAVASATVLNNASVSISNQGSLLCNGTFNVGPANQSGTLS